MAAMEHEEMEVEVEGHEDGNVLSERGVPLWSPCGRCSKYDKAVEYCYAVIHGRNDEERIELHRQLAALYDLTPSETRHITDNLPIPMDPYAETFSQTLARCASAITNGFQRLKDIKEGRCGDVVGSKRIG